jgi:nitrate ABC transporter ATP-binding subunit
MSTQKPISLQISDVTKSFDTDKGHSIAIKNINLDIHSGEFVSLIGHSGCGKSTLLNLIAGLYPATDGMILVDGVPITGPGLDRAMVFQQYSLLPWLSVRENVFEAVDSQRDDLSFNDKNRVVTKFLTKVGLIAHADKKPHQISGGMKQRVAIARAFAVHPKVMLLDEPFGALDALTKGSLHQELVEMWSNDSQTETVVMVTHDIDEAIFLSDRIVVMTNGPEATIGEIIDVPIPRPRDKRAILHDPAWANIKERLLYLLTEAYGHREELAA